MNETWIKLYRKIIKHDIFHDESAFRVFMWILCSVDYEKGSMRSGRFWAADRLGVNPITYYKIIKRLEKKYDLVTLKSNNRFTKITVKNWHKYQSMSNTQSNNRVTTEEQQRNTTQELRIKKYNKKQENSFNKKPRKTKHSNNPSHGDYYQTDPIFLDYLERAKKGELNEYQG